MINRVVLVLIGLLYFFALYSCKSIEVDKHTVTLIGDWKLVKTKDSYSGKWVNSSEGEVFCFLSEGRFKKYDKYAKLCVGSYLKDDSLYTVKHDCNLNELSYYLESLSENSLLLSVIGRHGKVFYQFEKK